VTTTKLFISHAASDQSLVNIFVDLVESGIGVSPFDIFCSSQPLFEGTLLRLRPSSRSSVLPMTLSVHYLPASVRRSITEQGMRTTIPTAWNSGTM
jgi:hypothetical protein